MIDLLDTLQLDPTVVGIVGFVYALALIAIYKMHNLKEGLLFLLFISASALMIFLFMKYSMISAVVVLLYIGYLLRHNFKSEP